MEYWEARLQGIRATKDYTKKEDKMSKETEFNSRRDRDKWSGWEELDGTWHCPKCDKEEAPRRASSISGTSIFCTDCGRLLTHRTVGGQGDPFRWTLKQEA